VKSLVPGFLVRDLNHHKLFAQAIEAMLRRGI
jgi:hypothetical protein